MNLALAGAAAFVVLAALAFLLLFRRLIARERDAQTDLTWCRDFSAARYRPMERLFAEQDYEFLSSQPGFHPRLYRKLQAERRKVFRQYLRCLRRDFSRLSSAARFLMVHASEDRPDLASSLLKQRAVFTYAMLAIQCRLVLQPVGIRVDVRPLVQSLDLMRDQLRLLSQRAQAPAAA
jgi:hypothetical protein